MGNTIFNIGKVHTINNNDITINTTSANAAEIVRSVIHDNPQPSKPEPEDIQAEDVTQQEQQASLFRFIHPSVTEDADRMKVHREVSNLVSNFPMVDICKHLQQMKKDKRVYLNVKPEVMFAELHRMGMPDEQTEGFSYKNFMHYFNIN